MKILVTGAGGFLGSCLVRRAVAQGHAVRAWTRRPTTWDAEAGSPPKTAPQIELFSGDITDPARWDAAVAGVAGVIHCAAVTPVGRVDPARSQAVNVAATAGLYAAAGRAGVARWVQISSMSAHPASSSVYGRTKLAADEVLRTGPGRPEWVILRPSLIYGPGAAGLLGETLSRLRKLPLIPVIGDGKTLLRPVHVEDVAEAALRALDVPEAAGQSLMIGGADEVTLDEFFLALCRAAGLKRRLLHLPARPMLLLTRLMALVTHAPPLNADNVLGILEAQPVEIETARQTLGVEPQGLEAGLRQAIQPSAR